jgi:Domain of unknown function (DUF4384)/Papain family cysteine protease
LSFETGIGYLVQKSNNWKKYFNLLDFNAFKLQKNSNFGKSFHFLTMLKYLFVASVLLRGATSLQAQSGLIFDDPAYEQVPTKADVSRGIDTELPQRASLKKYCPAAGDQQYTKTCVGWAVGYAARTILYAQSNHLTNKDSITQRAFSPDFIYRNVIWAARCDTGICFTPALEVLKDKGIVFQSQLKPCPRRIPDYLVPQAQPYKIEDLVTLFPLDAPSVLKSTALKKSLAEGNPVVIGAYLPKSFQDLRNDRWMPTESLETYLNKNEYGHAICVVGYDDTIFGGAFEIQNSYGERWGDKGFCWIRYADLAACTKYAFELINNIRPVGEMPRDSLMGDIQLVLADDQPINVALQAASTYQTLNSYPAYTQFKVVLNNHEPAYLYVFATDETFQMKELFPYRTNISPALTYKANQLVLPKTAYFTLDEQAGTDIFGMLYSKTPLKLDDLLQKLTRATGSIQERLKQVLGNQLILPEHVQYDAQKIRFKSDLHGKAIVPIIVEIPHR